MIESLPIAVDLDRIGVVAFCIILTWAIATGRLVTRREHQAALRALEKKDEQIAEKDVQLGHLKEVGQTVKQFTGGLQQQMEQR